MLPVITPGVAGAGVTVIVIVFEVTGEPVTQASLEDRMQITTSPLLRLEVV